MINKFWCAFYASQCIIDDTAQTLQYNNKHLQIATPIQLSLLKCFNKQRHAVTLSYKIKHEIGRNILKQGRLVKEKQDQFSEMTDKHAPETVLQLAFGNPST